MIRLLIDQFNTVCHESAENWY